MKKNDNHLAVQLKKQLNSLKAYRIETNVNRHAEDPTAEDQSPHQYSYMVPFCVYRGENLIAEIYVISENENYNQTILTAYNNARFAEQIPFFIFLKYKNKWEGISLYQKSFETKVKNGSCYNSHNRLQFDFSHLEISDYSVDVEKKRWKTDFTQIIKMIKNFYSDSSFIEELGKGLKSKIEEWFEIHDVLFNQSVLNFLEELNKKEHPFEITPTCFYLTSQLEDELFMNILGKLSKERLIRFTSLSTLAATLEKQTHRLFSIAAMNDKTEYSYFNQYLGKGDKDTAELYFNNYITSCTLCDEKDLTMWRLYGDDSKGVALEFEVDESKLKDVFKIAMVSYPMEQGGIIKHDTLDFVKYLLDEVEVCHRKFILRRLKVWQGFFKSERYRLEKEVRLLYSPTIIPNNSNWKLTDNNVFSPYIDSPLKENNTGVAKNYGSPEATTKPIYPLSIKKIWLGPNCPERETNKVMLQSLLKDMGEDCKVDIVEDLNYRPRK